MPPGSAAGLPRKNERAGLHHQPGTGQGRAGSPRDWYPGGQSGGSPCAGCLCQRGADATRLSLSLQSVLFRASFSGRALPMSPALNRWNICCNNSTCPSITNAFRPRHNVLRAFTNHPPHPRLCRSFPGNQRRRPAPSRLHEGIPTGPEKRRA